MYLSIHKVQTGFISLSTSGRVIVMEKSVQLCGHDSLTTISKEERFLKDFRVILKQRLQNYLKILKNVLPVRRSI